MDSPKFRVAICGAGIGGLLLAVTIGKYSNVPIDLYEAHSEVTTTGAGISIWRRTMVIMQELGLYEDLAKVASRAPDSSHGPYVRRSDIPEGGHHWFHQTFPYGPSSMHRRDMVDVLKKHLPSTCTVHLLKRMTTYTRAESGALNLHFADGTTATADVLVGADGIRSPTRKTMFERLVEDSPGTIDATRLSEYVDAKWTGCLVYRGVFPTEKLQNHSPGNPCATEMIIACGRGRHVVSYPVSRGTQVNVAAFVNDPQLADKPFEGHWVTDVSEEELKGSFESFEPYIRELIECIEKPSRWALHVVNELPLSTSGHVALLGDACHAMTPHFGAGAGQAIEDAFVLGHLIAHELTTVDNLSTALRIYQDIRLPFSSSVARESWKTGFMYDFLAPGYFNGVDRSREEEELECLQQAIRKQWEWQVGDASIEEWIEAERRLKESVS
ncbi:FAD/NAD(P)-binding domain-containing protein [Leucogyrophana mollusca]|uniref:FAD/NAD(P)-binding domain-containing protein n=1 Tax=Leucogyrophana mollusca TaxID=85980 RepID=A0ACB8BSI0_9AGAM|nr:FAD/NAD(P)-binding domain-containing protein [Leucogyrophana mollusca]